jgi:hypothetical protein
MLDQVVVVVVVVVRRMKDESKILKVSETVLYDD